MLVPDVPPMSVLPRPPGTDGLMAEAESPRWKTVLGRSPHAITRTNGKWQVHD